MPTDPQQYLISIANPRTRFALGEQPTDGTTFRGISGMTDEQILLLGLQPTSTATLQTPGQVVIHSTASHLFTYAAQDALFGSQNTTLISGQNNVFVLASEHAPALRPVNWQPNGPAPYEPRDYMRSTYDEVAEGTDNTISQVKIVLLVITVLVAVLGKKADIASLIVAMVQMGIGGGTKLWNPTERGTIHIHGDHRVLISSLTDVELAARANMLIMTPQLLTIAAGITAGMTGGLTTGMTAGFSSTVMGGFAANLIGLFGCNICSRWGDVSVEGTNIKIGNVFPRFPQRQTSSVTVASSTQANLCVFSPTGTSTIDMTPTVMQVVSGELVLACGSAGKTTITAGDFAVQISHSGIKAFMIAPGVGATYAAAIAGAKTAKFAYEKAWNDTFYGSSVPLVPRILGYIAALKAQEAAHGLTLKSAKAALDVALDTAASLPKPRLEIKAAKAAITNGVAKIQLDAAGMITIESPVGISLKCAAGSLMIHQGGVAIKGLISNN